jgi:hypothetical protein
MARAAAQATILAPWQPIMQRSWSLVAVLFGTVALLAMLQMGAQRAIDDFVHPEPLAALGGRVQLVVDEQDVGLVQPGPPIAARFTVVNTGAEQLVLRQAPHECCQDEPLPAFTIEPRQTGEIVALLTADDLLGRGRKHIRFYTSDPTNRELWVTVRGHVVRRAADDDYEDLPMERSVLVPSSSPD